jgi:two-component system response regulator HydG
MDISGRVLIVDDEQSMCELIDAALHKRGYTTAWRTLPDEALTLLESDAFDVVLTDLDMRAMNGLELCERIVASRPDLPVVVVTGFGSIETAIGAIRAGAYDFVTKPVDMDALALVVDRAVQHRTLKEEVKRLRKAVAGAHVSGGMIGQSAAMRTVYDLIERVADSEANVLITGESGTGKELVAHALHCQSLRRDGPFVAINCAAVPETLLESELFGHSKGAFTDARRARTGLFVQADGGTLFLDEVAEMPLGVQPKLLRALQERRVRAVGSNTELPFDARLVTATNRDLDTDVADKHFREDLFYRINVVRIDVPPLRERGSDVLLLAQYFIERAAQRSGKQVAGLVSAAAEKLLSYNWPGNVRELENCIERAVALTRYDQITVDDLPEKVRSHRTTHMVVSSNDPSELLPMQEIERRYIQNVLLLLSGNKTQAAKLLGFDRRTLYRKLDHYALS